MDRCIHLHAQIIQDLCILTPFLAEDLTLRLESWQRLHVLIQNEVLRCSPDLCALGLQAPFQNSPEGLKNVWSSRQKQNNFSVAEKMMCCKNTVFTPLAAVSFDTITPYLRHIVITQHFE